MRPTFHDTMLDVAWVLSKRSTCARKMVGCVLVDENGRVLSTGYNGVPPGVQHCDDFPCPGADAKPGQGLDLCEAVHAEANALLYCPDVRRIHRVYCTHSPCLACVKLLLSSSAREVIFDVAYAHDDMARERWEREGRIWTPRSGVREMT